MSTFLIVTACWSVNTKGASLLKSHTAMRVSPSTEGIYQPFEASTSVRLNLEASARAFVATFLTEVMFPPEPLILYLSAPSV